ncbi:hypothetical protein [Streptomyces sp. NPDC088707]|uniref:hypothetical protein n=1 Tax=Streptomyces sp. NPDC088707 TaxID=3365871 RepID=UPI0038053586
MTKTSKPTRGRPTRLDLPTINRIARSVQKGKTRSQIAEQIGVPLSTFQGWVRTGRRLRENGGGATTGKELLSLRLVLEMDTAERKRVAIAKIMSDDELGATVPVGQTPIGRPAVLSPQLLEAVSPLCAAGQLDAAAKTAGVDRRSVTRWLARGRRVHANGGARTEHERLCGILAGRVEAARPAGTTVVLAQGEASVPRQRSVATNEKVRILVAAVRDGATRVEAAERAGISYRTFARWLALGDKVGAQGWVANDHERQCSLLLTLVKRADDDRRRVEAAGPPHAAPDARPLATGGVLQSASAVRSIGEASTAPVEPVIVIGSTRRGKLRRLLAEGFGLRSARAVPHRA